MTASSQIVVGAAASHTTLMNTRWAEVDHLDGAHRFRDGLAEAATVIAASEPDLVVIVGSNHFRGFWLDLMPGFTVGVGDVIGAGEHGTPSGPQHTDPDAAQQVLNDLYRADFDPAFSLELVVDHGITHAIQYLLPGLDVPVLPLIVNVFAPPLPSLRRCLGLGEALGASLRSLPGGRRVAVIATGGLSHSLPFPDWRSPDGDDDEFLVESWVKGRGDWERYEERRRALIVGAPPVINEDFDRSFLTHVEAGTAASFVADTSDEQLLDRAGNGGNEVRPWVIAAAACGHPLGRTIAYEPVLPWLTGMAVAVLDPASHSNPGGGFDRARGN